MTWRVVQRGRGQRGEPPRDRKRAPLRRRDAVVTHLRRRHSHLVRSHPSKSQAQHLSRAERAVAQVNGQRACTACYVRKCARQPAERADATHEVAVLERGGTLRHDVVAVQARRDAAADDGAVHRAHERCRTACTTAAYGTSRSSACGLPPGEKCAPAPRSTIARTVAPRVASCSAARRRSSPSSTDKLRFKLRCGRPWIVQLDNGHAVRLVHPHAHQARPRSARRARPERAHHHECAIGGGGGQLGVAAGQEGRRQRGEAGAEPLCLGARGRCCADVVEPCVGSGAGDGGRRQAAGQMAALGRGDAGAVGTNGHRRGVNQQQRTRATRLATA
eukprot:scaffold47976_cov72-Phaeocystis_antarctica.AAC.3